MTATRTTPTAFEREALGRLDLEPQTAGELGAWLRNTGRMSTSGRVSSAWGGGDYAAQMLLGRLRKRGWCRTRLLAGPGASIWEVTSAGRKVLEAVPTGALIQHLIDRAIDNHLDSEHSRDGCVPSIEVETICQILDERMPVQ